LHAFLPCLPIQVHTPNPLVSSVSLSWESLVVVQGKALRFLLWLLQISATWNSNTLLRLWR
jgi:hypothetical protein